MIPADDHVNGCMHFDAADLSACQILLIVNVVDMIIFNDGKYSSEMADNTGLSAVMDITAADDMGTDIFFGPSFSLSLTDGISFRLCAIFIKLCCPFVLVFRL